MTVIAIALTFGSGAMDVASFTRLGNVFASVMTGNIVLWGLAAARGSMTLASHTTVAIAGYIAGVAGGTWIGHGFRASGASGASDVSFGAGVSDGVGDSDVLPDVWLAGGKLAPAIARPFLAEFVLLAGFTAGWEISGSRPGGWAQFCLLAVAAAAMGMQASAVRDMGLPELSTTFLTGTLTGLVATLVRPGQQVSFGFRRFGVLIGLAAGALLSGLLIVFAAAGAPVLPLAAITVTLVLAFAPVRLLSWRSRRGRRSAGRRPAGRRR
jgi:uncharacterized membrane protein YoaK (UPF0700 family)